MKTWFIPMLCGLGAGILSAWGIGGGTLLLLVMTLFLGVDQRAAQGINLLFFLPTAAGALLLHRKHHCLDRTALRSAVPPALLAALLGTWLSSAADPALLRRPFGLWLLFSAVSLLRKRE